MILRLEMNIVYPFAFLCGLGWSRIYFWLPFYLFIHHSTLIQKHFCMVHYIPSYQCT
ncbi:hypothetical protein CY34DRAFT_552571 [Suillus luteus UH-Slu-Lm8-n1]|uniref:Uncharacterized protein n=1 Tax=Suillus luteus UH-Slu-Lm8-n1 TaxID=930992 RepID=A0A0D0AVL1_9AGAM|nr:hypothetical protein CY34DRAFT_552571 [Suillus luteus UH-Slu-Lm8-n1]